MLRFYPSRHMAPPAARPASAAASVAPRTPAELAESRAQHQVFLKLSVRYEEHCRRSDLAESPALCDAADRFRRERSLGALIAFADLLDELGVPEPAARRRPRA